ncbi:unnamed protein product [Caenorhabditis brenneri]
MNVATNIREALYAGRMSNNEETPPTRNYLSGAAKRKSYRSTPQVSEEKPLKIIKTEEEPENPMFDLLQEISRNPQSLDQLLPILDILTTSNNECTIREDNNSNFDYLGHHVELDAEDEEWQEEFKKLDREEGKSDCKDHDRRRQMAKNREYARKCVQKKKDMRKQAEIRCFNILKRIQLEQKQTAAKERNSNFAVDLRKMMNEEGVEEQRTLYEALKSALIKKYDEMFAKDETVNLNFHRFAAAKEEFEKAAIDLRMKNGVIGTLGSRKIRAKQQMEWRQHLYNTSVNEHKLRRETKLAELADDYVRRTVPSAAPLVQSIPKGLLDELIKNDRTSELEEFCRFVAENAHIFDDKNDPEERSY